MPRPIMLRDRDGNLWIGTSGQGLLRLRDGRLERFSRRDGLSSDMIKALAEDREGDLWVATARGIDRFRDPKVARLTTRNGLSSDFVTAVYPGHREGTWVGTSGGGMNLVLGGRVTRYPMNSGQPGATVLSLYSDRSGRLWMGSTHGLTYLSGGRFVEVRDIDGRALNRVFLFWSGCTTGSLSGGRRHGTRHGVYSPGPSGCPSI